MRPLVLVTLLLASTACGALTPQALGRVDASPPVRSPDLRDPHNRLDVHYHLNTPATVSSQIVAAGGAQWPIATDASRPTAGDYVLQFDGTVAGPGPRERRVLPEGDYRVVLDVRAGGQQQHATVPLSIRNADTVIPDITDLALVPDRISPNFDAQDDVTHINYRLSKTARIAAFLDSTATDPPRRVWMGQEERVVAGEQTLTWDGMANSQPVPDGRYLLGIRARDDAGNVVERSQPLLVEQSGVPEAAIVLARIGPPTITRGAEVCLDAVVRNTGQTVLRTQGPDPGYVYNSLDTYSSIDNHAFAEHAGYWRVGLNLSGSPDVAGATYAYRWGFGHDLQPGDEIAVHGCVRVMNEQDKLVFFAGLVQENIAIRSAGAGLVRVQISS